MKRVLVIIIEICLVLFIVFCIGQYLKESRQYRLSNEEYGAMEEYSAEGDEDAPPSYKERMEAAGIPLRSISFDTLLNKNEDFIGWLYVPGLDISYPIVQGEDDEYYLHHTFSGKENTSGCVFLEAKSEPDFSSYNSFLYGHNMRNGTMFGSLKRLTKETELYKDVTEFYVYTPAAALKYDIYSFYICSPTSDTYRLAENEEGYKEYQEMASGLSVQDMGVEISTDRPTLTLATCSGSGQNKKRFVVHGILSDKVEVEDIENTISD